MGLNPECRNEPRPHLPKPARPLPPASPRTLDSCSSFHGEAWRRVLQGEAGAPSEALKDVPLTRQERKESQLMLCLHLDLVWKRLLFLTLLPFLGAESLSFNLLHSMLWILKNGSIIFWSGLSLSSIWWQRLI